jgi:HEAT repeat protein
MSMTHHTMRGAIGLIEIMFLCLSVLPFLTTSGFAGQPADTTVSDLIDALKDPDPVIRQGVTTALGGLGPKAAPAGPALIDALNDQDPSVRQLAARALGDIGPQAEAAVPALIDALK